MVSPIITRCTRCGEPDPTGTIAIWMGKDIPSKTAESGTVPVPREKLAELCRKCNAQLDLLLGRTS